MLVKRYKKIIEFTKGKKIKNKKVNEIKIIKIFILIIGF